MPDLVSTQRRGRAGRGHSLFEVLAALALASAGVIGFMHVQHLREATETELLARLHATLLARDIARKITANPTAVARYHTAYGAPPALTADCRQVACSRGELAAFHVAHWKCRLGRWSRHATCRNLLKTRGLLPQGDGSLRPRGGSIEVSVRWLDAQRTPQSLEIRHALLPR